MKSLWSKSKADSAMAQRLEKGGWIMMDANGKYTIQPFPDSWTIGPCGIDMPVGTTPPVGAVGWVHTHPYTYGERQTACEGLAITFSNGQTLMAYQTYRNNPSDYDGKASVGFGFGGYIIDKDKVTEYFGDRYNPDSWKITNQFSRCGY